MKKLALFLFMGLMYLGSAQVEDAWVYFTDKPDVDEALANPISILTQNAIDRKSVHNIAIDERDVPVNENYITQLKNTAGVIVIAKSKWFNCVFVRAEKSIIDNLLNLNFVSSIDFANKTLNTRQITMTKVQSQGNNNKFEAKTSFNYGSAAAQIQQLNAHYLHEQDFTGRGMVMAIMDSGFPGVNTISGFKRIRDEGRLLDGYDFVNRNDNEFNSTGSSHGTQTFSDIAGFIDGQFVGTAPDASYYLFVTEDVGTEGPHEEAFWVEAAERADSLGVDVINTSLGYSNGFDNPAYEYDTTDMDGQTAFISKGANIAFEKGMLLVVSAGNSGNSFWGIITAPGDAPGVLTVGAVNSSGQYVSFSSRGPTADNRIKPDVMARGSSAAVISSSNVVTTSNGTSFSSPIMAGAVTCLWQAFPDMTNTEIMQLIKESANLYNNPNSQMGYGIPDFRAILENLSVVDNQQQNLIIYPNPTEDRLFIEIPLEDYVVNIYTIDGRLIQHQESGDLDYISLEDFSDGLYLVEIEAKNLHQVSRITSGH